MTGKVPALFSGTEVVAPPREVIPHLAGTEGPGPAAFREEEPGINWGRYLAAVKRYRWLILLLTLLGTAGGVVATRFIAPEYVARATIWVERGRGGGPLRPAELLQDNAWVDLLRSYVVLDPVVLRRKLYVTLRDPADSSALAGFAIADRFETGDYVLRVSEGGRRWRLERNGGLIEQGVAGDSIGRGLGWRWAPSAGELGSDRDIRFKLVNPREVSNDIVSRLSARMPDEGNFLPVTLKGTDGKTLAATLNAITEQFIDVAADLKRSKLTEMRIALDSQVAVAYENLKEASDRLKSFQINTITQPRTGALPINPGLMQTQGAATSTYFTQKFSLETIRQDRQQLEAVLARGRSGDLTVDAFQLIPASRTAPALAQALSDLTKEEAGLRALLARYTEEHPLVKQARERIEELKSKTIPELGQALVQQLKAQEADLESRIRQTGTELREIPEVTITEMRLQREYQSAEDLYKTLQSRQQQAKLEELSAIPDVRILDQATTPQRPTSNTAPKIIAMAFLASLGAGLALALLLDQLDRRFRYPEQVTQELGLPILGAIPAIRRTRSGELPTEQAAQVVEAFRTVRLNLAHSYGAAGPILVTVSSAGPGDGKSLVSSNLAVSFAEAGYQTLLVDGDIRRGELHRMFSLDRRPGLLDFLTGEARLPDILRATSQRGLTVIPCGTRRQHGPELLGSTAMAELMAEMKARYNVIIMDSPPLSAGIDPFVLGTVTGNMMVVFRTGETDRQMAEAKLRLLDRLPVRVLGAVLNEIQSDGVYRYYTYLYAYAAEDEPEPARLAGSAGEESPDSSKRS